MKMLRKLSFLFMVSMVFACNCGAAVTSDADLKVIKLFIDSISKDDRQSLADNTEYPLGRGNFGAFINNKDDFIKNYDMLFDSDFVKKISISNPAEDWKKIGWQGIMFDDGSIWLSDDGKLISVNHTTNAEKSYLEDLDKNDRQTLHESLKDFVSNKMVLKTDKYLVRIDAVDKDSFRYAAWNDGQDMSSQPSVVIAGGKQIFDGSAGNNYYEFKNQNTKYVVYANLIGTGENPYELEIYDGENIVESLPAKRIR